MSDNDFFKFKEMIEQRDVQPITIKKENSILMNYKLRRKRAREMTTKIMKSNEFYNFHTAKRKEINKLIMNTLKHMNEVNKQANEYTMFIDLTDSSNKQMFKHFDEPNIVLEESDNNFYLVRPEEQTKPQRQTQVYQLEQLLDILKGSTKPKVTFVVKTDQDYSNKIYVYDGQHRLLLVFNLIYEGNTFSIEALEKAFDKKRESFPDQEKWCDEWVSLYEFMEKFDGDEFGYSDLLDVIPEIEETFNDKEVMQVKGDFHICDSKTASLLFKKLNEQVSAHSTTQRTKADLVGSKFNDLLFKTELKINKNWKGYLSKLVQDIGLFNLALGDNKTTSPKTFGYNLESLDKQTDMNMDQFLLYIYAMMLTKIRPTTEIGDNENGQFSKIVFKFDMNVALKDSEFNAKGRVQTSSGAFSSSLNEDVKDFWVSRFSNLVIDDEEEFIQYLTDIVEMAVIVNTEEFSSVAKRWYDKLMDKAKPMRTRIDEIQKTYTGENWKKPSDLVPQDVVKEYEDLKFSIDCLKQYRFSNKDQMIVLLSFMISSKLAKYKLHDWMIGFVETMISNFQSDWTDLEVKNRTNRLKKPRGTWSRITFQSSNYCHRNAAIFKRQVSDYLEAVDTSLWRRSDAIREYIEGILMHFEDILYKCPYTCEWVTIDDFQSHHLHFRSEGDANKVFAYWFPLSPKFNNYISDNHEKNIVDVETDGNFIDACDSMIDMMKTKMNQTSNKQEILDWKKSIRTIESWKDQAELWFDENN